MKQKVGLVMAVVSFCLFCVNPFYMQAVKWEDKKTPISYKVEMVPWEEVKELVPNKSKFTIIDVDTGLKFNVQRRAGNKHADVQPLTKADTKIMKEIYNGKWSWKRRAIIVLYGDQMFAASMSGMPHGAGALLNGFRGHFCVHFYGSTTHRSKNMDIPHQIMILKAAGKLDEYINTLGPYELIDIFTVAINQRDQYIFELIASESECPNCFAKLVNNISYLSITRLPELKIKETSGLLFLQIPADIQYYSETNGKEKRSVNFIIKRNSLANRWMIDWGSLYHDIQ